MRGASVVEAAAAGMRCWRRLHALSSVLLKQKVTTVARCTKQPCPCCTACSPVESGCVCRRCSAWRLAWASSRPTMPARFCTRKQGGGEVIEGP